MQGLNKFSFLLNVSIWLKNLADGTFVYDDSVGQTTHPSVVLVVQLNLPNVL